jgi:multidrug resistance efflux pump
MQRFVAFPHILSALLCCVLLVGAPTALVAAEAPQDDSGQEDSGADDSGAEDPGQDDAGDNDSGAEDSEAEDSDQGDTGQSDSGQSDAAQGDSSPASSATEPESSSDNKSDAAAEPDQHPSDQQETAVDDSASKEKSDPAVDPQADPQAKPPAAPPKPPKKKTPAYRVQTDRLKIELKLDGIFVADTMEEVALRPEQWTQFQVVEAVAHGATVKKGDVLVRFDAEKLEQDLAKESLEQSLDQLELRQDEEELPRLKRKIVLRHEQALRDHEQTQEDFDYYHATDRPNAIKIAHYRYKNAQAELAAAQEELQQLKQMYEADELTEETEEIVLKRQEFAVETAELILEITKKDRDYMLEVVLPRTDEYFLTAREEAQLEYQQAKTEFELGTTRKNYQMEQKRNKQAQRVKRHGKLLSDKGLMVLRAPCDGTVYYGKCDHGKWSQISSLEAKLQPFSTVTANSVLMTIVQPGGLHIQSNISEKELIEIHPDHEATITPTADPELHLSARVAHIASAPGSSNKFPVRLDADLTNAPRWLVAGMTCEAKLVVYDNLQAITIPMSLVQTDKKDDQSKYVLVLEDEKEKPSRRTVKLGRKQGKVVEILEGLAAGDRIVKPEKSEND